MHDDVKEERAPAEETPPSEWTVPPVDPIGETVPTWADPVYPSNGDPPPDIILGELLLMYIERTGRRGFVNLIQVATAFVNE